MLKPKKVKMLITAAYHRELNPLCRMGQNSLVFKDDTAFLSAGIGPVAASLGLAAFLAHHQPDLIITAGTAGTFHPHKYKMGDVVLTQSVSFASGLDQVYAPQKDQTIQYHAIKSSRIAQKTDRAVWAGLNKVSVYCPQEITKDKALAAKLKSSGFDVENLEAFAFARVAHKYQIPIVSILGITNVVGREGHQQWKTHEKSVCEKMAELILKTFFPAG